MVGHSDMTAPTGRARMVGNPLTAMEYLDRLPSDADVDLLFDQGKGDGIPRTVDFDVVVRGHAGALPAGEDIGIDRQQLQAGPVQRGEQIGAAGALAAHHAHIQLVHPRRLGAFRADCIRTTRPAGNPRRPSRLRFNDHHQPTSGRALARRQR